MRVSFLELGALSSILWVTAWCWPRSLCLVSLTRLQNHRWWAESNGSERLSRGILVGNGSTVHLHALLPWLPASGVRDLKHSSSFPALCLFHFFGSVNLQWRQVQVPVLRNFNQAWRVHYVREYRVWLLGLYMMEQTFLEFRCSVIERRAKYQLKRAEDRDHIVEVSFFSLHSCYLQEGYLQEGYWFCC